jgi:hypothetical protein
MGLSAIPATITDVSETSLSPSSDPDDSRKFGNFYSADMADGPGRFL